MSTENINDVNSIPQKRPAPITIICILGFFGALVAIPMFFTDQAKSVGAWYPPFGVFSTILGFVSLVGLWKMKKWGFYLYVALAIFNQIVMLIKGIWSPYGLMLPVLLILIVANSRKQLK